MGRAWTQSAQARLGSGREGLDFFGPDLSSKCKCVLMYVMNIVHLGNYTSHNKLGILLFT